MPSDSRGRRRVPLVDLGAQRRRLDGGIDRAIRRVLEHGRFVLGPEVGELEERLGQLSGAGHVVTCASGSDAILLVLLAWGAGPGDAVFVPTFTFAATAEMVALVGATPFFVDVSAEDFNMAAASLSEAVEVAADSGLRPRGVVPVDLFGQPAAYEAIEPLAAENGLWVLGDAAQSFGARFGERRVGTFGQATATSFFPSKPLGCYGDGGAVFTDDPELAEVLRSLREHGRGPTRHDYVRVGINGRLDTIQAAVLLEKLSVFGEEVEARQRVAERYASGLSALVGVPRTRAGATSVWAQYTVQAEQRDRVRAVLEAEGVSSAVYYPVPLHLQPAYSHAPRAPGGLAVSESLAARVLSLPIHPYLSEGDQDRVLSAVALAVR
ncbi:MAG TPA: DegT/DnrJ/EryC1/StrS family aminotransferase [Acidimicrobiales bacterium]|nr:DegT/DnrJ/EryC1/StrS family aminotransferase [Acidimicrobiales bacterium]